MTEARGHATVLLVEDDALVGYLTAETLRDLGYEVDGPHQTLACALAACETCTCDVALLDVDLGRGDTSEPVAAVLRERRIPLAFVTAFDPGWIDFRQSSEPCVTKPVSTQALDDTVLRLLNA